MDKKAVLTFIHGVIFICFAIPVLFAQQNAGDFLPLKTGNATINSQSDFFFSYLILDTNSTRFLPLFIGNLWVYEYFSPVPPPNGTRYRFRSIVTGDSVINGHTFYFLNNTKYLSYYDTLNWFRVDSANGSLISYKPGILCRPGYEILIDSLPSEVNDIARACLISGQSNRRCYQIMQVILFNHSSTLKSFCSQYIVNSDCKAYVKNFGISSSSSPEPPGYSFSLIGCVINGIKYGDTSLIGIEPISSDIPKQYNLYQNYPNPFNPVTKIRFDIPSLVRRGAGVVVLKIYDLLGREVATLVNEQLKPGTYEVEWDGNGFSSGVYFYSLITNEYTETRKLILLK